MTLREAQTLTLQILKQVMEEKLDQHNVQLAQVRLRQSVHVNLSLMLVAKGHEGEGFRDS